MRVCVRACLHVCGVSVRVCAIFVAQFKFYPNFSLRWKAASIVPWKCGQLLAWDAACPCACVFTCVVCLCVCVLSSWHSSTNLSSIQIFHSDGKRPDSNSIVPWKVHFHCSTSNKICHVLKGQMPGLGQMWGPVMIFTCQIVSNPRLRPRVGGGGGVSRNNDRLD